MENNRGDDLYLVELDGSLYTDRWFGLGER